jgi:hypothetical protein
MTKEALSDVGAVVGSDASGVGAVAVVSGAGDVGPFGVGVAVTVVSMVTGLDG